MSTYGRRRRKRNNSLTGVAVFIIAAMIFLLLSTTVFFNLEKISVTGESGYTAQEIIDASGLKAGDNLVRTGTEKCAQRIESKLPYVEKATVSRSFPNTMVINIEPSIPAANFRCDGYILLISRGGKVLEKIDEPKVGLLNFTGVDPSPEIKPGDKFVSADEHKTDAIDELLKLFVEAKDAAHSSDGENDTAETSVTEPVTETEEEYDPASFYEEDSQEDNTDDTSGSEYLPEDEEKSFADKVTLIDVTDRAALSYTYDGRIVVKLGSVNDLDYKLNFSRTIVTESIGDRTEGVLTILSDSKSASFLDKETMEYNAQVFSNNMAAQTAVPEETYEEEEETEQSYDPIME